MTTCLFVHPGAELFGSDRMLLESVIAARREGFRAVVALPERGPLMGELLRAGAEVVLIPMLVLRKALLRPRGWPVLLRDSLRGLGAAWRLIGRVRPDIVYVNTITIPMWPLVARVRRTRVLSHVHEAEASASRLVNSVLYAPHLVSDAVVVNSRFSLDTMSRALRPLARRGVVVYNGVAAPEDTSPPRERLDPPARVAYLGRLSPRKGPDVVIEAARILRDAGVDVDVAIVGSVFAGYEWFEEQLHQETDAAGLTASVVFHGFQDDVWPFLEDCDVLIVPSRVDEPFGNTSVEGILARRPVVASDTSGLREAAGGYPTTRLVRPGDAGALAAALQEIVASWDALTRNVEKSRLIALERHSTSAYRAAISTELRRLVGRGADHGPGEHSNGRKEAPYE